LLPLAFLMAVCILAAALWLSAALLLNRCRSRLRVWVALSYAEAQTATTMHAFTEGAAPVLALLLAVWAPWRFAKVQSACLLPSHK
jgi:hypothetical protein